MSAHLCGLGFGAEPPHLLLNRRSRPPLLLHPAPSFLLAGARPPNRRLGPLLLLLHLLHQPTVRRGVPLQPLQPPRQLLGARAVLGGGALGRLRAALRLRHGSPAHLRHSKSINDTSAKPQRFRPSNKQGRAALCQDQHQLLRGGLAQGKPRPPEMRREMGVRRRRVARQSPKACAPAGLGGSPAGALLAAHGRQLCQRGSPAPLERQLVAAQRARLLGQPQLQRVRLGQLRLQGGHRQGLAAWVGAWAHTESAHDAMGALWRVVRALCLPRSLPATHSHPPIHSHPLAP